jgi:hypothetical protein
MTQPFGEPPYHPNGFGDLIINRSTVTNAPLLTRIALASLASKRHDCTVDEHGINVADQVWYQPIELTPDGMTLICRKTRDLRPLVEQARQNVAAGG